MKYWLIKSEPSVYSWAQFVKDKKTSWDGVRNYQAAANLKVMKKGDRAFFYHSNEGKEIVGVAEVARESYPDPKDVKFVAVEFKPLKTMKNPVSLAQIKAHVALKNMALVRQSRLSVSPVTSEEWKQISKLGGING